MNEFPSCYRQTIARFGTEGVVNATGTEYLELLSNAGVTESMLTPIRPHSPGTGLQQHHLLEAWSRR